MPESELVAELGQALAGPRQPIVDPAHGVDVEAARGERRGELAHLEHQQLDLGGRRDDRFELAVGARAERVEQQLVGAFVGEDGRVDAGGGEHFLHVRQGPVIGETAEHRFEPLQFVVHVASVQDAPARPGQPKVPRREGVSPSLAERNRPGRCGRPDNQKGPGVASITAIEGIGDAKAEKLRKAGIRTCEALLEQANTKKRRQKLAEETKISEKNILTWVNHADLMRIKGVSGQYSELLEAAGVDSVAELKQRNAANLAEAMLKKNNSRKNRLVKRPPSEKVVQGWIDQAKKLKKVVSH